MNASKKTLKMPNKELKKQRSKISKKSFILAGAITIVLLLIIVLFDQFHTKTLYTINGEKYKLDDLRYFFYTIETAGNEMDNTYKSLFNASYWDMPYDQSTGATMRDLAKTEIANMIVEHSILYREAIKNNYTLNEDDSKEVDELLEELLKNISETEMKKNNFTSDSLKKTLEDITLSKRYKDDMIKSFNIDYESIKNDFDYEKYRQFDVEYFTISKNKKDDEGKNIALNDSEKEEALTKIKDVLNTAKDKDKWSEVLNEDEKEVSFRNSSFTASEESFSKDIQDKLITLDNDESTEILEDENGFYVFKMINNDSKEKYNKVVLDAQTAYENQEFARYFNDIEKNYKHKVNINYMRSLNIGNITTD